MVTQDISVHVVDSTPLSLPQASNSLVGWVLQRCPGEGLWGGAS